jgi:nucleotide-binding universal stress UspA family protein
MQNPTSTRSSTAIHDFQQARRQAALKDILARLTGKSTGLLSYEDVRAKLRAEHATPKGLKNIPLDAIIGSVGRYTDFTRDFLPRQNVIEDRWVRLKIAASERRDLPPIEVYQIGEAYFVLDGNHRVSVARQMGATHIDAYVTELGTKVPITPDTQAEDLIIKAEYADFLARTRLDELRPGIDLSVTIPGKYRLLAEHIQTHAYFLGLEEDRQVPDQVAVTQWYDKIYLPVIAAIRAQGIMREFPNRTETDLYLWVTKHRTAIEQEIGWNVPPEAVANDFATQFSNRPERLVSRLGGKMLDAVLPDELEAGPPPGEWRRLKARQKDVSPAQTHLFLDLLVPVTGQPAGWVAVDQAMTLARCEQARLHGLHVLPPDEEYNLSKTKSIESRFLNLCRESKIQGDFGIATGPVARQICDRARWVDLIVLNLNYPPASQPMARLSSGFGTLIRRCPRPILAVPGQSYPLKNALLAYDASPKSKEALYVAAYLAGHWGISLHVLTVLDPDRDSKSALQEAMDYLESNRVEASSVLTSGDVGEVILNTAGQNENDLIIMGGYGYQPVVEVVLGSSVDRVLGESRVPVLICR